MYLPINDTRSEVQKPFNMHRLDHMGYAWCVYAFFVCFFFFAKFTLCTMLVLCLLTLLFVLLVVIFLFYEGTCSYEGSYS